jgi:hypothetical protein
MKITKDIILMSLGFGLLIAVILFTVFGCRCRMEFFEGDMEATDAPEADTTEPFSKKEAELFEGLQTGKFSENQIKDFMKSGVLNEKIIDKFLSKMTKTAEAPAAPAADATLAEKAAAAKAPVVNAVKEEPKPAESDPNIEKFSSFTGSVMKIKMMQKPKKL